MGRETLHLWATCCILWVILVSLSRAVPLSSATTTVDAFQTSRGQPVLNVSSGGFIFRHKINDHKFTFTGYYTSPEIGPIDNALFTDLRTRQCIKATNALQAPNAKASDPIPNNFIRTFISAESKEGSLMLSGQVNGYALTWNDLLDFHTASDKFFDAWAEHDRGRTWDRIEIDISDFPGDGNSPQRIGQGLVIAWYKEAVGTASLPAIADGNGTVREVT